jgi:asparagine synthase (glutamine-hydrolysing)
MCGIAGFWTTRPLGSERATAVANAMALRIQHRGPDGSGVWVDADGAVALAHRRLAIVDLSAAGHQPMRSVSGRYEMVFNGEIYNHNELRRELPPGPWRGHSDTETLLAGFEHWGIEQTLRKTVGMFAIALWDRELRRLTLARDRLGEKPLYYGRVGEHLLFASELKAMRAFPGFAADIDRSAVSSLLRHCYIAAPLSIYQGIHKLPPATFVHFDSPGQTPEPVSYWSACDVVRRGDEDRFSGSDSEAIEAVERQLSEAIALQRVADVPLGAFLSGGIDSSLIVALMQKQSAEKVRTFTIGFNEKEFNEAEHAMAVAQHLGTDHTEMYVSGQQALDLVPRLASLYCEPFADSSQIPTILVSQIARQHVTVALSGDAGDELYGGYNRYGKVNRWWSSLTHVPMPLRKLAGGSINVVLNGAERAAALLAAIATGRVGADARPIGERIRKLAAALDMSSREQFYRLTISHITHPERFVIGSAEPATVLTQPDRWPAQTSFDERMMFLDQVSYLPDDILTKVDRAAMSVSLETRVPFLDHRVVEQAWRLPLHLKRRDGVNKWILRQILFRHVPRELIERPKAGFVVPLSDWLRGPLREWAENLLDAKTLREQGLLNVGPVRRMWQDQISGRRESMHPLWNILMLQAWLAENRAAA